MGIIDDANKAAADKAAADQAEAQAAAEQAAVDAQRAAGVVNPTPAAPLPEVPPVKKIPTADGKPVAAKGTYEYFYCLRSAHPGATDLIADPIRIFAVKVDPKTGPLNVPPFCPACNQQVVAHAVETDDQGQPQIPASIVALHERLSVPVNV